MLGAAVIGSSALAQSSDRSYGEAAYYPRLDAWPENQSEFGLKVIPITKLEKQLGDTYQVELDTRWKYFRSNNFQQGVLDADAIFNLVHFGDDANVDLPEQLVQLYTEITAVWRYTGDYAVQVGMRPGLYSALDAVGSDGLNLPFSGYFHRRISPELSGTIGAEIRPRFELGIMPYLGLDWARNDSMMIRAGIPESRVDVVVSETLDAFASLEWYNTSYTLDDGDLLSRDSITLDYIELALGGSLDLGNGFSIGAELGSRFNRSLQFNEFGPAGDNHVDVDPSAFGRVSLRRPL
ncbi:MAG: DUF6268 family outer membrane beta-barrel protein [Verrucomicrobia bacterium]|nr:DUF6268 family outer membrane beta-barrel protein [Verrucomicrobiota bacterium]